MQKKKNKKEMKTKHSAEKYNSKLMTESITAWVASTCTQTDPPIAIIIITYILCIFHAEINYATKFVVCECEISQRASQMNV